MDTQYPTLVLQVPFVYTGLYTGIGQSSSMAPATADWDVSFPNTFAIPESSDLEVPTSLPLILELNINLLSNDWATPIADGMLFSVFNQASSLLAEGRLDADVLTIGRFTPVKVELPAGRLHTSSAIGVSMTVDPSAGDATPLKLTGVLSLYRKFAGPFPQ